MATMMKIMAAAPQAGAPGDVLRNEAACAQLIDQAKAARADLLVLPELCLTGAGCGDLFKYDVVCEAAQAAALRLAARCEGICCVMGLPLRQAGKAYSLMLAVQDGQLSGGWLREVASPYASEAISLGTAMTEIVLAGQTLNNLSGKTLELKGGERLALSFAQGGELAAASALAFAQGATVTAFVAVHAALAGSQASRRAEVVRAAQSGSLCVYVNGGYNESSTDWVADGLALIASPEGRLAEGQPFAFEAALYPDQALPTAVPVEEGAAQATVPFAPPPGELRRQWCREAVDIAAHGLRQRMERIGAKKALIGLSGGLDSAMALIITCVAFERMGLDVKEGVLLYSMPGFGSGTRTRENSALLAEALGIELSEIDIRPSVRLHLSDIGHSGAQDAAYENAQARERTQILMDLANMHGGLMVGTGDLSELALGFTTYGGDHLSMYAVNGGLYKSAIRLILRQLAQDSEAALAHALLRVLDTPVSPELLPGEAGEIAQKTEDIVGPYELNDFYLHHFLQERRGPAALYALARAAFGDSYTPGELLGRMRSLFARFFAAQFKRSCLTDGPQVLAVSISPRGGLSLPSDASAGLWLAEIDQLMKEI